MKEDITSNANDEKADVDFTDTSSNGVTQKWKIAYNKHQMKINSGWI